MTLSPPLLAEAVARAVVGTATVPGPAETQQGCCNCGNEDASHAVCTDCLMQIGERQLDIFDALNEEAS